MARQIEVEVLHCSMIFATFILMCTKIMPCTHTSINSSEFPVTVMHSYLLINDHTPSDNIRICQVVLWHIQALLLLATTHLPFCMILSKPLIPRSYFVASWLNASALPLYISFFTLFTTSSSVSARDVLQNGHKSMFPSLSIIVTMQPLQIRFPQQERKVIPEWVV